MLSTTKPINHDLHENEERVKKFFCFGFFHLIDNSCVVLLFYIFRYRSLTLYNLRRIIILFLFRWLTVTFNYVFYSSVKAAKLLFQTFVFLLIKFSVYVPFANNYFILFFHTFSQIIFFKIYRKRKFRLSDVPYSAKSRLKFYKMYFACLPMFF